MTTPTITFEQVDLWLQKRCESSQYNSPSYQLGTLIQAFVTLANDRRFGARMYVSEIAKIKIPEKPQTTNH